MSQNNASDKNPHGTELYLSTIAGGLTSIGISIPIPVIPLFWIEQLGILKTLLISITATVLYFGICWLMVQHTERLAFERLDRYRGTVVVKINPIKWIEKILFALVITALIVNLFVSMLPDGQTILQMLFAVSDEVVRTTKLTMAVLGTATLMFWYSTRTRRIGLR